ncbi:MAG: asparaginase domain-containing protein [Pseudomonadota bacterium]
MEENSSSGRVRLIYAGGTVGAVGHPLAPLSGVRFETLWNDALAPRLPAAGSVQWTHLEPAIDSTDAVPVDWARIARPAFEAAAAGAPGAIVLHGTDTLAEAAAALAFLATLTDGARPVARLTMPLTLLGAMTPLFATGPGGAPAGLAVGGDAVSSLTVALAREAGNGAATVMLACDGRLLPGTRAVKLASARRPAFGCPMGEGLLPDLPPAPPEALLERLARVAPHLGARSVLVLPARPEAPGRLAAELEALVAAPGVAAGAIVLLGFGDGNLPGRDSLGTVIETARARGLPVVVGTRARHGGTRFGDYAAGAWLKRLGVIEARDMTPEAATTKLHVALALAAAEGWDGATLERYITTPIAGEITPAGPS